MLKKIVVFILALCLMLNLVACGKSAEVASKGTADAIHGAGGNLEVVKKTEEVEEVTIAIEDGFENYFASTLNPTKTKYEELGIKNIGKIEINKELTSWFEESSYKFSFTAHRDYDEKQKTISGNWDEIKTHQVKNIDKLGQIGSVVVSSGGSTIMSIDLNQENDDMTIGEAINAGYWHVIESGSRYGYDVYKFFNSKPDGCSEYDYVQGIVSKIGDPSRAFYKYEKDIMTEYILMYELSDKNVYFVCNEMIDVDSNNVYAVILTGKNSDYVSLQYSDFIEI